MSAKTLRVVGFAVVVGVVEDEDAVAEASGRSCLRGVRRRCSFRRPTGGRWCPRQQAIGLLDVGFGGEDGDVEAVGDAEGGGGLGGGHGGAGRGLGVGRRSEGMRQKACGEGKQQESAHGTT